jgi:hypothetical protein
MRKIWTIFTGVLCALTIISLIGEDVYATARENLQRLTGKLDTDE